MKVIELKRQMDGQFTELRSAIERRILDEGERMRGHMDVLYEKFKAEVRLSLDKSVATANEVDRHMAVNTAEHAGFVSVLDDHESRLKVVESP